MRCWKCNASIEDDALFCPVCGEKQEVSQGRFCPICGSGLEADDVFCSVCGTNLNSSEFNTGGHTEKKTSSYGNVGNSTTSYGCTGNNTSSYGSMGNGGQQKNQKVAVVVAVCVVAVLIIGVGGGLFLRGMLQKEDDRTETQYEMTEEVNNTKEIDLSDVDINAVADSSCTLEGNVKKTGEGVMFLSWSDELSVYGLDENEEKVLIKSATSARIDDSRLQDGLLESIAANEKVKISGDIYIKYDTVYLKANRIVDEDGKEVTLKKEEPEQPQDTASQSRLSDSYIIPESNQRLLTYSDVQYLTLQEINYAKNEIYARHGRRFQSAELQNYFNTKRWYNGTIAPENFSDSLLSSVEQKNVAFLRDVEFSISSNGYQLDR